MDQPQPGAPLESGTHTIEANPYHENKVKEAARRIVLLAAGTASAIAVSGVAAACGNSRPKTPGATITAPARTQTNHTKTEQTTTTVETPKSLEQITDAKDFVDAVNQRMSNLTKIISAPGVITEKKDGAAFYTIIEPSREYPHKYDGLQVVITPNTSNELPSAIFVTTGLTTNDYKVITDFNSSNIIVGKIQRITHTAAPKIPGFIPNYLEMNSFYTIPKMTSISYEVSPDEHVYGIQQALPQFGTKNRVFKFVPTDRSAVAAGFDEILTEAENILADSANH